MSHGNRRNNSVRAAATSFQRAAVCCVYEIKAGPAGELHHHPQFDPVVRRVNQDLLCPEVPFRRLNGRVPEEQLDLLQFTARRATQFRAGATTVVRGDSRYSGGQRVRLEQLPDDLLAQAGTLGLAGAVYRWEYVAVGDPGGGPPRISRHLDPSRHRRRPDAAVLSN